MPKLHMYDAIVTWAGDRGTGTSHYAAYDRTHEITAAGQPAIAGSSDTAFRGDPKRWNPEQLLVVSLAQCHMLWYLHLAAVAGVVVTGYVDRAVGTMAEQADGGGQFVEVVLRPTVTVSDAAMAERAMELHDRAHELCFIARSVNFPVRHEASIDAAADPTDGGAGPANGWRAAAAAAVRTAYERYLDAFTHADLAAIDAVVAYPLAHISQGDARLCDTFPIDPAELRRTSGWHTTVNARYDVVAVSPEKAHVILHRADRVRADGSLIETVAAFYAFTPYRPGLEDLRDLRSSRRDDGFTQSPRRRLDARRYAVSDASQEIRPFHIDVPQADLDDRLARNRWANELPLDTSGPQTGPVPPAGSTASRSATSRTWSTTGGTTTTGAHGKQSSTGSRSSPPRSTASTSTSSTSAPPSRTPSR